MVDHATFADDGYISEAFPAVYGMIQFLPLMALEISEFNQFKLMLQAKVSTTRTADLCRRGLFDFVSPKLFFSLHSFLYASMALSVFWMTQAADDLYDLAFLDATIMSIYFQVVALLSIGTLLRNMKLEDVNFEVYRDSPATT